MKSRIYYTKPSITELEVQYATDAAANGWGEKCYDYIKRFEEAFKDHLCVEYAIATSSCTGALHMGMSALGIGSGDEVILADTNWIATAAPIVHLGANPVFVDVLEDSWCINPDLVEQSITPRTKAIIAVHLYGNLCDMDKLLKIGEKYGVPVIEDAAEAIGSVYNDKRAGSMGKFGVFSFHGTKTLSTGEGGMFVTRDIDLYEHVLTLSSHGIVRGQTKQFWPEMVGFKYKMSNIQAALGCAQMERIDKLIEGKRRVFEAYREGLAGLPLKMNPEPASGQNGYWMPTIVVDDLVPFNRDRLLKRFRQSNIDGRVFFWPLSMLPKFKSKPENKVSYRLYDRAVNLPSYKDLTVEQINRVVAQVREHLEVST